jgi:hypothetical protein
MADVALLRDGEQVVRDLNKNAASIPMRTRAGPLTSEWRTFLAR